MDDPKLAWICQKALPSLQCHQERLDAALFDSAGAAALRTFFTGGLSFLELTLRQFAPATFACRTRTFVHVLLAL